MFSYVFNKDEDDNKNKYTVFTLSECTYCTLVKELLKEENDVIYIQCDRYLKEDRFQFIKEMNTLTNRPEHKTFPFVFKGSYFIGGYDETKIFYEKNNLNFEHLHN